MRDLILNKFNAHVIIIPRELPTGSNNVANSVLIAKSPFRRNIGVYINIVSIRCFPLFQAPYGAPGPDHRPEGPPPLSEQEFEEIMGRNRTVSSSAIARAVSDAAAGEYASAIETLVTAISLIKQSKVAADDRCKILISSLQDTLRGVETKSYGSGRRGEFYANLY